MTAPDLMKPINLMERSFTINWTIRNPNNIHSYIITWINLRTSDKGNLEVQGNTTSYNVTGLSGVDNYNLSVAAKNPCGIMTSNSITVYGKDGSQTLN